jgi:hypothetical protein
VRGGFYLYDPRFSEGAKILCEGWAEREAVCHIILHSSPTSRGVCKARRGGPQTGPPPADTAPLFVPVVQREKESHSSPPGGVPIEAGVNTVLADATKRVEVR